MVKMSSGKGSSSSSEGDERYAKVDERKRKRMISNRESARRSRMRKEEHMKDLIHQLSSLNQSKNEMLQEISRVRQQYGMVEASNQALRAQLAELKNKFESLEIVLSYVRGAPGLSVNMSMDPLLKPWQLPHQSMPLMASASAAGMFQL